MTDYLNHSLLLSEISTLICCHAWLFVGHAPTAMASKVKTSALEVVIENKFTARVEQ